MNDDVVSGFYSDSHEPIRIGDLIIIDGHPARVEGVYTQGSAEAEGCGCEDTGALAVTMDNDMPVLFPFGHQLRVTKQLSSEKDR